MSEVNVAGTETARGRLIVVSGPSGCGKSTLLRRIVARPDLNIQFSVSATSRAPRVGEVDGKDYHFWTREVFESARDRGEFLEWAEVHENLYGTPEGPVREALASGRCVILEIDVQGAAQVVERFPDAVTLFVTVESFEVLELRLRSRGTDEESTIQRRLTNARRELAAIDRYQHRIINDDLERAVEDVARLLENLGCGGGAFACTKS